MATDSKHLYFIDLIRIVAFLSIVMIHTATVTYEAYSSISHFPWLVSFILSYGLRFSTPLFVMISGYLFLSSDRSRDVKSFYAKRAGKILLPLLFWNIFYYFFYCYFNGLVPGISDFWGRFFAGGTYFHLYFLFLIAGLYIITPFLKRILSRLNLNLVVPLLILVSGLYYYLATWTGLPRLDTAVTLFLLYIGYYLAGYWVSRWRFHYRLLSLLIIFVFLFLALAASLPFINRFGIYDQGTFLANRLSLLMAIPTLLIFHLLFKLGNEFFHAKNLIIVDRLALVSMGVYLIHPIFIKLFSIAPPFEWLLNNFPLLWLPSAYTLSVITSVGAVLIIKKIPLLNLTVN